jgi:hypothetical protein
VKLTFRPSEPADAPAIVALLAEAGLTAATHREHLYWKYWKERWDWRGPRSFVLADGDAIVAHAGIVPGTLSWTSERLRIIHLIDWAARRDSAGAGVSLMKRIGRLADGLIAIGGATDTLNILPQLGFRRCGCATRYVRTLRPLRILRHGQVSWRLLARLARSAVWRLSAPSAGTEGWQIHRLGEDEVDRAAAVFPRSARELAVFEHSADLLRYTLTCPIVPIELYVAGRERECRPHGCFVLAPAGGQVRLADCWVASEDPAEWRSIIQCAVRQATQYRDAAELVTWSSDPLFSRCLRHCGFHARDQELILLKLQGGHPLDKSLRVQMLDTDAPYRDPVDPPLWA